MESMLQHSSKYDPTIHEELGKADWDAALPRVLKYAVFRAKIFRWLGDKVEPETLVQEAIARAYGIGSKENYRNWNTKTCPDLGDFLIGIIRSITSHKAEHEAEFPSESLFNEDGSPKDEKILKSADETAGASKPKTPEEEIIENENLQAFKDELDRLSDEDGDLGMVILCIEEGISKPRHIAEEAEFDKEKVNYLLKRLRRRLKKYNPKMKRQSSKERQEEWA
jgi:DNA-directed RNA polymerase specialized sigma24 family protein